MSNADTSLKYRLRIIVAHRDLLRNHVPFITKWYIASFRRHQLKAAHRLKGKIDGGEKINVAFFLSVSSMWKNDYVFRAMRNDSRFHVYIVILPYSFYKDYDKEEIEATLQRTKQFVEGHGYEYVIPRCKNGRWQDVKKSLKPDIVFFSLPYKDMVPKFFIYHFRDVLTCYVSYSVSLFKVFYRHNYDLIFHNLVGMNFVETPVHKKLASENSRNHAENVVVSGYPGTEVFLQNDFKPKDVWKKQSKLKKRVIWGPHHSVEAEYSFSTFMHYCDTMLKMAEKYLNEIQFVFKPHPALRFKLEFIWGKERTDDYFFKWETMENTQLEETSYIDLFLTSDAMIHDSGSFTAEYLYTRKPVMFLVKNNEVEDLFSPFGALSFRQHYLGRSEEDIDRFLHDVVIDGNDPMKEGRERFFNETLLPEDGLLPSQRIIKLIENTILGK